MKKSAKIYAVLIALALLFTAGCGRKTADSDNVESSNELPSFISETCLLYTSPSPRDA